MTCDRCYQDASIGAHGVNMCPLEPRKSLTVVSDEIPGGQWFENGFKHPRKFYSHSEHRAALAKEGKEINAKWVPGDKHLTRWDTVDLDAAAVLVTRGAQARAEKRALAEEFPITVTDISFEEDSNGTQR